MASAESGVRTAFRIVLVLALVVAGVAAGVWLLQGEDHAPSETPLSVAAALSSDTSGYARATAPRTFQFPADHGPHPEFRTEWWYYTGNVAAADGRRFAYQFTIFRTALKPPGALPGGADTLLSGEGDETWATSQLYMAHLALTDAGAGRHTAFERFSRGAAGLAGAQADPYRVWLEDWQVMGRPGADSVQIRADAGDFALDVVLSRSKPIAFQGDRGFDRKGPEPGNASYYFSMTRMATAGTIRSGGATYEVAGWSWMDREWSTSALSGDQVGWDWFSLQLDNGMEVMYYQLRRDDGSADEFTSGSITDPHGDIQRISASDVQLKTLGTWMSPQTGTRYPSEWSLEVPKAEVHLEIEPLVADQELELSIRYWEGAVRVRGTSEGKPVEGFGFVEMTGYGEEDVR